MLVAVAVAFASILVASPAPPPQHAAAQVPPNPNPEIDESCGVDVTLVLDASGSIKSSGAVEQVRGAADAFLDALVNTSSTARVTQFGTVSQQLAPATLVDDTALAPGGALRNALNGYYANGNSPPRGPWTLHQYRGGNPQSASSWRDGTSTQYTNWDQALDQAATTPSELMVFVTDGDPTAYDFGEPGDPFPASNAGYQTDSGLAAQVTIDRAVVESNAIKSADTRVLAVGVGAALSNPASEDRLEQVAGPQTVRDADLAAVESLNDIDVALVTNFENLARFLRSVVLQLCSPSLTIRKLAQSATDPDYLPAPGWAITATPDTENGQFDWILPAGASGASATVTTDANGFAQFQWEPDPGEQDSSAVVSETLQPDYTAGRPGPDNDVRCQLRNEDGDVRVVQTDLAGSPPAFTLDPIGQEIVTCTLWNSFDYAPAIAVTKVDSPTEVRGDLDPPAVVTASYVVTNPGNTPLRIVSITDDTCSSPVQRVPPTGPNAGDSDQDGWLDVGEAWQYTCSEQARVSGGGPPVEVTNTVTVIGVDPAGTDVEAEATDDVTVYVPDVTLDKVVNGVELVTVPLTTPPTDVTYTYTVTNTGNTPLGTVTLTDDTPPCTSPTPDPGNTTAPLLPGQVWTYTCVAPITESVLNTGTVTGVPLNPEAGNVPFPEPNPAVGDTDVAQVDVVNPDIDLTKSVSPVILLLGQDETGTVTYTFLATNPDDGDPVPVPPLNRPGAAGTPPGPSATDPGWVVDDHCTSPATYVTGDGNGNVLLDPGETWEFTCQGVIDAPTVNVASITGVPSNPDGTPLGIDDVTDLAFAFVEVLRPSIHVEKTALTPVVLDESLVAPDPGAPISGPDVPDPPATTVRPAEYHYEVTNTGTAPLDLTPDPPVDDTCSPLVALPAPSVAVRGDTNDNGLLDVHETWVYSCATTLDREGDGNTPPVTGDESGLVTNTVTATGVPTFQGTSYPDDAVSDTDIARVTVIEPGLTLTKTPSASVVRADGEVTYTFVVTNTGDVGLELVGPSDDKCAPVEYVSGDLNGNGLLDGADSVDGVILLEPESWTFTCTRSVALPEEPALTDVNEAAVLGIDPLGNVYEATADAEVRVFDPAIHLTKTVSDSLVLTGSTVTYDFTVTNTGNSPVAADDVLADIQLVDASLPAVPSCARPTLAGGDTNSDGLLQRQPAETWTYRCQAVITQPTTNVAVVRGTAGTLFDPPLPIDVFDVDAAFVQPFSPAIEVTKTAAPTQLLGSGPVTYTYTVRNTGDVPLGGVAARITDNTCSPVTYVSGDQDGDGLLDTPTSIFEDALDEIWTFTCTTTISQTTTNTVVVAGTPTDPTGTPLCTSPGAAGQSRRLQVPGGCDVTDNATATVTVVIPATVIVTKRTTVPTTARFAFSFNVPPAAMPPGACDPSYPTTCIPPAPPDLNCSDITARAFTVLPPDPHGFDGDGDGLGCEDEAPITIGRGESFTLRNVMPGTYVVTEPAARAWRLTNVTCTDPSGDSVVTIADRGASIVVAPGETVTCTFTNAPAGTLPATGNGPLASSLATAVTLVGLGAVLVALRRRGRRLSPA